MLIRFTKEVSLDDVGKITERCEELGVRYKYIQELSTSYLVVESADRAKLTELFHQFRHMDFVGTISFPKDPDDPLDNLKPVKIKCGNRWIGRDSRPVIIAGSPYLESQKNAVDLANKLSSIGANIYKAGPYRPTETLSPKSLYERASAIITDVSRKSGIPSTGMIEALGPKTALSLLKSCALHVPGHFMFDVGLLDQLAKIGEPVLLERHPDASTELWLDAARMIVGEGNPSLALVEAGKNVGDKLELDLVLIAELIDTSPLPLLVYPSKVAKTADEVRRISRASLACGASGVILDVHPDPFRGLLSDGFCLSVKEFEVVYQSLKPLIV